MFAQTPATNAPTPIADLPVVLHQLIVTNFAVNLKFPVDTNVTEAARFGMDMEKLNLMHSMANLNPLGKSDGGVEKEKEVDPDAAMTVLAFDALSIEPLKGLLQINNLRVSNPPTFSRRNLIQLEQFRIDLDPDTVQTDTLVIEDILLSKPRVRYERQITSDNIQALQAEIEQAAMRRDQQMGTTPNTNQVAAAETGEGQKVIIEHILVEDIVVRAKRSMAPSIPTPPFNLELRDIGKEEGGKGLGEASSELAGWFREGIIGAVSGVTGLAGDTLKGAGALTFDAMGNLFGGMTDGINHAAKGVKDGTEELVEETKKKRKISGAGGRRRSLF